jgi:hypothetical protein
MRRRGVDPFEEPLLGAGDRRDASVGEVVDRVVDVAGALLARPVRAPLGMEEPRQCVKLLCGRRA